MRGSRLNRCSPVSICPFAHYRVSDNESNHAPITRKDQGCLNWKKDRPGAWFQGKITVIQNRDHAVLALTTGFPKGALIPLEQSLILPFLTVPLGNDSMNGDVFYTWFGLYFWPELKWKRLIIMTNANIHKCVDMIKMIESHGCVVQCLPP